MNYYVGGMPISDELYHYGILGQKWGIRRYQNPDGTLTVEGKKRYGSGVSKEEAFKNFLNENKRTQYELAKKYGTVDSKIIKKDIRIGNKDALWDDFQKVQENMNKSQNEKDRKNMEENEKLQKMYDEADNIDKEIKNLDVYTSMDFNNKRGKEAADLGLKALSKMGVSEDPDYMHEKELDNFREWFMVEDQTVGLSAISDLVNRGKTKSEIFDMMDKINAFDSKYREMPQVDGAIVLAWAESANGGRKYLEKFIDACEESKNEMQIKHGMEFAEAHMGILL